MQNRMSSMPWLALPDQRPPLAGTSHTMSADPVGGWPNTFGLGETWRGWEAGTSSEFLNRFVFTHRGGSSNAETEILEDWISFRYGSSKLDHRARDILGSRMALFRAKPAMSIVIGGLAGPRDSIAEAMRLGLRRVLSIRTFLLACDIAPGRIGIAVRGSGWSVAERPRTSEQSRGPGSECRLQITDARWTLARN